MILYLDDYDIVTSIYDIHKQYIYIFAERRKTKGSYMESFP